MSIFAYWPLGEQGAAEATREMLAALLRAGMVDSVLAPMQTHDGRSVQPALIVDPERLRGVDPYMPVLPVHSARMVSLLTERGGEPTDEPRQPSRKIAAVMRPCELRATIELAKLNQIRLSQLILIGLDCVGTIEGRDAKGQSLAPQEWSDRVLEAARAGSPDSPEGLTYRSACSICETPSAWTADICVHTLGVPAERGLLIEVRDPGLFQALGLSEGADATQHLAAVQSFQQTRHSRREEALDRIDVQLRPGEGGMPGLVELFETCQQCHNCTVACPICYCKECLFRSDTLAHEPRTYFGWAIRKGAARLPGDTLAFQLTRMSHVSTSCVGCGLCTSACPADLPVDSVFQAVARRTQGLFDYVPGRSLDDPLPPATFNRSEFVELGEVRR
jgi:formate dehydrogenase subunit beta